MIRGSARQGWLAACCVAALVAVAFALVISKPDPARAAPPTGDRSSIPTAPGAKPTPDATDDPCQITQCAPSDSATPKGKRSYALPGKGGGASKQKPATKQTQQASTKDGGDGSSDLVGALTGETQCSKRPHVNVPKSGGKAAGKCVPVDSFGEMYVLDTEGGSITSVCGVSPKACTDDVGTNGGGNATQNALATQYTFVWKAYELVVNIAAWFTGWSVSFQLFGKVAEFADSLRGVWDNQVIDRVGLGGVGGFVLGLAVVWAGLLIMFHRFRRGFAELVVSILIAVIASAFILHPGGTIQKTMDVGRYLGLTVAAVSSDPTGSRSVPTSPAEADRVVDQQVNRAVADKLVTSVLVKPHMIANTGRVQTGVCEKRYWEMLAANGKAKEAAYKRFSAQKTKDGPCLEKSALQPSVERILVATLLLIMAVIVCAFCLVTAGLLLLSQIAAAGYLAVAGIVGTLAPLPGWGRNLLVKWITGLLIAVAGTIASVLIVVVYLDVLGLILGLGQSPLANFAIAILVAIAGFKLRKRLTAGFRSRARQIGAKLEGTLHRPGGETQIERQQRKHTSVSHLHTASAVAAGAGAAVAGEGLGKADEMAALPSGGSGEKRRPVGFGSRVRNAMGQTRHGRLAMDTATGPARAPLPSAGSGSAVPAGGAAGLVAAGVGRGSETANRTAHSIKSEVIDATTPSGSAASGERATRTASRVSAGGGPSSSDRARELIAEMQRRQREREQELSRRQLS